MADYNLSGLSTRSFEQLIQALSTKILGPGTIIFGDGPDGGREATFEGKVSYPSEADPWNGYIVVQAKFKQRPEGTTKDGDWAIGQLKSELNKFLSRKRSLRKPEYYLFCTNVTLSPKHRSGSKDRIAKIFAEHNKRLPLSGYDVWDYDKLRVFLDTHEDIRKHYSAWITPGDVLASIVSFIRKLKPDFQKSISAFLQKELLADQYVNLDQAGHSSEEQIPMARVFVDLVATSQPGSDTLQEGRDAEAQSQRGIVHEVLEAGARRLNEDVGAPQRDSAMKEAGRQADFGRFVLVGGPGQGKSTTAQYLCQVYRVALLADHLKGVSPECKNAVSLIQRHCKVEDLPAPGARRFPVRVVLSDFARELASDKPEAARSLLAYIAQRIRHRTSSELSAEDLKEWIASYPWFLVLDGLDEVPASTNRNQVLSAIADFWVDVATNRGDLLVVATTRPQGYGRDFSPDFYAHRYLVPLSVKHALRYAQRLTEVRFGQDIERGKRVMERLTNASKVDATARLMTSPLQVTIMATLVDRAGQPPPERWRLFSEYYDVIYKREMERDNPAAKILRNQKTNIDGIHQLAGLELQTEGERTGRTDARLSREDFAGIVKSRLGSEGYTGSELNDLCNSITDAATQRLVFLVGVEADSIGFEIRSLQEFMAAEAFMEGADGEICERLKAIAPITYWRNVFLFAAGKCFAQRLHLRDVVVSVCENLNEETELDHRGLSGSELALDLVRDGTARQVPKFQNRLSRLACQLVSRPCGGVHQILSDSYYDGIEGVFKEELPKGFPSGIDPNQSGGICTASWLALKGISWAGQLADSDWPKEPKFQMALLRRLLAAGRHPWLEKKIVGLIDSASEIPRALEGLEVSAPSTWSKALGLVLGTGEAMKVCPFRVPTTNSQLLSFRIVSCSDNDTGQSLLELPLERGAWKLLRESGRFLQNPTRLELSSWLKGVAEVGNWKSILYLPVPWPLRACLRLADSPGSIRELAERASIGDFGDRDDWMAAEARWVRGVTAEDLVVFDEHNAVIGAYLRDAGFPIDFVLTATIDAELGKVLVVLLDTLKTLRSSEVRATVANDAIFVAGVIAKAVRTASYSLSYPNGILSLARESMSSRRKHLCLDGLFALSAFGTPECMSALDEIGKFDVTFWFLGGVERSKFASAIRDSFVADTNRRGLGRILAALAKCPVAEVDGKAVQVPFAVLEGLKWTDKPYNEDLLFLSLANPELSPGDAGELARMVVEVERSRENYTTDCLLAVKQRLSFGAQEQFVLELCKLLPQAYWEARSATFELIDDLLRQRRSTLSDPEVRMTLKLN